MAAARDRRGLAATRRASRDEALGSLIVVPVPPVDTRALMADIEREVRERRRRGDLDPEFERELDEAFAAVAPPGAFGGGFDTIVDQAARHAVVDYDVPITGRRPLRIVKRAVKQLTAWYLIFVGRQVVAFAGTTLRALRILGARVDAVEGRSPATDPRVGATTAPVDADVDLEPWTAPIVEACADRPEGRVLHGDCGDGALLVALADAGIDAYGTDARLDAAACADARELEVRRDGTLEHLRTLPDGALAGLVLSGCVDRLVLGDLVELAGQAVRVTAPGAPIVVVGRHPAAWALDRAEVARDLAPGHPLHAATWQHLLEHHGARDIGAHAAPVTIPDAVRASSDPALHAVAAAVFAPASFMVVARRA